MMMRLYQMYLDFQFGWWLFFTTFEWWRWLIEDEYYDKRSARFFQRLNGGVK